MRREQIAEPVGSRQALPLPVPWLIGLVVVVFWWPLGSYWQSDDYMALHYAQDFGRALQDFGGGQYGLQSLVLFYRPLITVSMALDQLFGMSAAPFVAHLSNAVAHGISATCLALIACRFTGRNQAFAAGLVWGLWPSHAGSVFWAVGRVDSHTTVWIVLTTLFLVQWCGGQRRTRLLSLTCFALALCSKELAIVVPGIVAVFCFALGEPGSRLRAAWTGTWPYLLLLLLYFGWRYALFGEVIGGYGGGQSSVGAATAGLGVRTAHLLNPLMHSGADYAARHWCELPGTFYTLGFVPPILAIAVLLIRQRPLLLTLLVLFLGCSVPMVQLWANTDNPMLLRNFYLPMMPLAVLLAAWGWRTAIPALAIAMLPFCELRSDFMESWQRCKTWHTALVDAARPGPNFVVGLPRSNDKATALEMHLGIDRLLQPPFCPASADTDDKRELYALRPMSQQADAHRLPYGAAPGLPFGTTLAGGPQALAVVTRAPALTDIRWHRLGPVGLDLDVLEQVVQNFMRKEKGQAAATQDPVVVLEGTRAGVYRATVFTASGYLTTFVPDTAAATSVDGHLELGLILYGKPNGSGEVHVGDLLQRATALDLSTRFPVLIEADLRPEFTGEARDFVATHACLSPVWIELDRLFADWWP